MFKSLIFRYLAKEVFITLAALTVILLLIFMSNQFVQYLNRAANGQFPVLIIMKLMMLEVPNLMSLLLPLGFYVSLLLAYGRLYADSEMTVLMACGYGPQDLLKHSLIMASFLTVFVALIMIWISPHIYTERAKLLRTTGLKTLIQSIVPGRFQSISNGQVVFYVESMAKNQTEARHVFLARQNLKKAQPQWSLLLAEKAYLEKDPTTNEDYLILEQGHEYEGMPGTNNYQVVNFEKAKRRLPHQHLELKGDMRTEKTQALLPWVSSDPKKAAEFQWRLSIPIMVLTLTLLAVPLSRVNPRSGKFAKLLPALVLFVVYANFLFVLRGWIGAGKFPIWLGMWWLHGLVILIGLGLIKYNKVRLM